MEDTGKHSSGDDIQIPDGLRPLLEAFAKETLKSHPDDILYFAKIFFDELHHQRESKQKFFHYICCCFLFYKLYRLAIQY